MHRTGHYGAGLLAWAPVGYALLSIDPALAFVGGLGVLLLSTLPDVDLALPFVAHRGVTHTLAFLLAVSGALAALGWHLGGTVEGATTGPAAASGPAAGAAFGFMVGVVGVGSHLLSDVLTPMGVPLLWPVTDRRYSVQLTPSRNPVANWALLLLGLLATAGALLVAGNVAVPA